MIMFASTIVQTSEKVTGRCLVSMSGPGHEAEEKEAAEQDRHRRAARDAEGDGRDERAAFLGVAGRARPEHAAHVALAEALCAPRACARSASRGRTPSIARPRRRAPA